MTDKYTGGPAFPAPYDGHGGGPEGMTLRDWFAGQALAGMNAADRRWENGNLDMAVAAYSQADAMLAEREKIDE